MAELEIGQHCDAEHCGQLDFLPFVCDGCSRVFCLTHRSRDSHGCPELTTGGSSGGQHEDSTQLPCTYTGCGAKELVEVLCPFCKKHFCLRHRHQPDHKCDQLEAPKQRMAATQQLVKQIVDSKKSEPPNKVRRGAKNAATAAKVALMKLKLHALGDKTLPQSERVYFQVYLPLGGKDKSKAMFFCKKWSVGKVVDYAATIANLKNDNNKVTAKDHATISHGQALLVETIITFQLVFTIFASCDKKRSDIKVPIPLIIGLSVTIGHLFAIPYTGASMNPARSLATSIVFAKWDNHWIYWVGPLMGSILASFIYEYLFCPDPELKLRMQASFRRAPNEDESVQLTVRPGGEYNKLETTA